MVGGVFAVATYFFVDSLFYALIAFCVGGVITISRVGGLKDGLGCLTFSVFVIGAIIVLWGAPPFNIRSSDVVNDQIEQSPTIVPQKDEKLKIPAYLHGVEDVNSDADLANFYFGIANKFYHNEMGLKGTQEQIDAGNKLMIRVYDFLGKSAKKKMLNIDSMKIFVKNFAGVSEFRKKKALEDLQIGIGKIESLNK
ncbi:hypothetical protein B7991_00485 [Fibrobacter sp. UWB3]|nr:hypothetical protein B7991_00485 [Fibrobacter sp. UWB3]